MNATDLPLSLKAQPINAWGFSFGPSREVLGINITNLLSHLFPDYWDMSKWHLRDYDSDRAAVKAWCEEHGAFYYFRGREDFSLTEARELALEADLRIVVYEDLS